MKLLFHVLKCSKKLNIDNETNQNEKIGDKLIEETEEVICQLGNLRLNNDYTSLVETIKETFDVIQVCILILWRCNKLAKRKYDKYNLLQEINLEILPKNIIYQDTDLHNSITFVCNIQNGEMNLNTKLTMWAVQK